MLRLFFRLYVLMAIGLASSLWLVNKAVDAYFSPYVAYANQEAVRGQMYALLTALRPQTPAERQRQIEAWQPHYGLKLTLLNDPAPLAFTAAEHELLDTGRFIFRNDYSTFIAALDPPAGMQYLMVDMPAEPTTLTATKLTVYTVLGILLACVLIVWVRPHWRDLEILRKTANRFGAGELSARAEVAKGSSVRELAQHFNQMAERIAQLIGGQRELTNAISHELRTPIARLSFELDLVKHERAETVRADLLADMRSDLQELEAMVSELLTYARLEHPELQLVAEPVDARAWLASVLGAVTLEAEANGIVCSADETTLDSVALEPKFMARALLNLLLNAIHYARTRVTVKLQQAESANTYELIVDDDGPGIPLQDRTRVFEPFTRLDESRNRATGGFGLGLAIVRRVAEWHGGSVEIVDSPLRGCRIVLSWPVQKP